MKRSDASSQVKPEAGDYLQNGKRLVMVLSYTKTGAFRVEDAQTYKVDTLSSLEGWKPVERRHG